MPTIGRNAPCPCGSGKKYKQCHEPIDAQQATQQRRIRRAGDSLLPRLVESLDRFGVELPGALARFWNGAYSVSDVKELDEHEDRGSERFLTWFAFDAHNADGLTPVQRLAADPGELELSDEERTVLAGWTAVRLQPYIVAEVRKGQSLTLRALWSDQQIVLEDRAAAKRIEVDSVLIAHLTPVADVWLIAGAAAELTPDTTEKLREFAALKLEALRQSDPGAGYDTLIDAHSEIFNHFVMALPREEQDAGTIDELLAIGRATLNVTADKLGIGKDDEPLLTVPSSDAAEADAEPVTAA